MILCPQRPAASAIWSRARSVAVRTICESVMTASSATTWWSVRRRTARPGARPWGRGHRLGTKPLPPGTVAPRDLGSPAGQPAYFAGAEDRRGGRAECRGYLHDPGVLRAAVPGGPCAATHEAAATNASSADCGPSRFAPHVGEPQ